MESDSTRAIPEYDREQHKYHIKNSKIERRSTTSDRFLFCLVSTFALPFVLVCLLGCIVVCCLVPYSGINAEPFANYLLPKLYPDSKYMWQTGYGGSDSIWRKESYCIEDDSQAVVSYYEAQTKFGVSAWQFEIATDYDDQVAWYDEKEGLNANVSVSIYPLDLASNADAFNDCNGLTVLVIYRSWRAQ